MRPITNIQQLNSLMNETYVYAIIVLLIALLISLIVANIIPWQGGKDKSYVKRRTWFIVIGVVAALGLWLYNDLYVKEFIKNAGLKSMFSVCNLRALGISIIGYFLIGLGLMFIFRHTKFGSILGKEKQ